MNEDKISFICETVKNENLQKGDYLTERHRFLKITIALNDKPVEWIDICPYSLALRSFNHTPTYWDGEIIKDANWSSFYPFTCSCSVPGCAGIWDGIYVKVRKHSVEWRAKPSAGYKFLGKSFFSFERKGYEDAIADFLSQIEHLSNDFEFTLVVDPGYCAEGMVTGLDFLNHIKEMRG